MSSKNLNLTLSSGATALATGSSSLSKSISCSFFDLFPSVSTTRANRSLISVIKSSWAATRSVKSFPPLKTLPRSCFRLKTIARSRVPDKTSPESDVSSTVCARARASAISPRVRQTTDSKCAKSNSSIPSRSISSNSRVIIPPPLLPESSPRTSQASNTSSTSSAPEWSASNSSKHSRISCFWSSVKSSTGIDFPRRWSQAAISDKCICRLYSLFCAETTAMIVILDVISPAKSELLRPVAFPVLQY
mmetsp:Transcript_24629/g.68546  ORF Transcript_24629/g.68546 Transcript_24629/m.68546 type:complete len:248 (+) Transcript_24629:1658-2401(+)